MNFLRILTLCLISGTILSHDMWLETDSFIVDQVGQRLVIRNGNGTIYQKSENAVTVDRIDKLIALSPSGKPVEIQPPTVEEPWLNVALVPGNEGNYWVGLSTKPRKIRLTGSEFTEYLKHDGIPNILKERQEKGISDRDEVEQYSKYVKAYLQVAGSTSQNHDAPLGLAIEIVPLQNPYAIRPGESLPVEVWFQGKPLEGLTLHAGFSGQSQESIDVETGADGQAVIPISGPGKWYVRGIHLIQVDQEDHSYESYWATLTFEVK